MKLLLDENLPKRLKADFPEHNVYTVSDLGWNGKTNGELLKLMIDQQFEALITFDKNLQYQQNLSKYPKDYHCSREQQVHRNKNGKT